jgi:hypothetical protein
MGVVTMPTSTTVDAAGDEAADERGAEGGGR